MGRGVERNGRTWFVSLGISLVTLIAMLIAAFELWVAPGSRPGLITAAGATALAVTAVLGVTWAVSYGYVPDGSPRPRLIARGALVVSVFGSLTAVVLMFFGAGCDNVCAF